MLWSYSKKTTVETDECIACGEISEGNSAEIQGGENGGVDL